MDRDKKPWWALDVFDTIWYVGWTLLLFHWLGVPKGLFHWGEWFVLSFTGWFTAAFLFHTWRSK